MPFAVHTLDGAPFVLARLYEAVSYDDSMNLLKSMTVNPGKLQGFGVICDVRDGDARLTHDELHRVSTFVRARQDVFAGMRWAMVVTGLLEFGLARAAGLMTVDLPFDYWVCRSIDEACNWVGLPGRDWTSHQAQLGIRD